MKKVIKFQVKIVNFRAVKNRCMLHGRVFVIVTAHHLVLVAVGTNTLIFVLDVQSYRKNNYIG